MRQEFDKYLGIVGMAVVLWYLFKNPQGTATIFQSLGNLNSSAIGALQGRTGVGVGG